MLQKNSSIFSLKIAIKILHFGHFNVNQLIFIYYEKTSCYFIIIEPWLFYC